MAIKKGLSEDWLSFWLGLAIFALSVGLFAGTDILGWCTRTNIWTKAGRAFTPVSNAYESMPGAASVLITYAFVLLLMGIGALLLKADLKRYAIGFTIVYWISLVCLFLGHYAYIAATPDKLQDLNIGWSMSLTGEAGYILALIAGLLAGYFMPGLSDRLKEAIRPELYLKTAIVIMGAAIGMNAAEFLGLASSIMFRSFCAAAAACLIFWASVYWLARRYFRFSREWAAPLASGISIGGVSATIATGGAIRARPVVPIMISSLVVVFAVFELILLPWCAKIFLWREPLVAAAWTGLAVKSDGAAVASGAITDAWIRAQAFAEAGISYKEGWMLMAATTVKMFIDIFIGVWALILAFVWRFKIDRRRGDRASVKEIRRRFPKFLVGYVMTFAVLFAFCYPESIMLSASESQETEARAQVGLLEDELAGTANPQAAAGVSVRLTAARARVASIESAADSAHAALDTAKTVADECNVFLQLFFAFTFFTIGVVTDFKVLRAEGIGRLAGFYAVALFGFVIWTGLLIAWIFFHGMQPPVA